MSTALEDTLGDILDHFADVIEGGDGYAGGDSFPGIAGFYSIDDRILRGEDAEIEVGDTVPDPLPTLGTFIDTSDAQDRWSEAYWVRQDGHPKWFALCSSSTTIPESVGAARRIVGYAGGVFTTDAFPNLTANFAEGDTFEIREGFSRAPNGLDINSDDVGMKGGFDRRFDIRALPGRELDFYGAGKATYETQLEIRLRLTKPGRAHDTAKSALQNASLIRNVITRPASRDTTYVRALLPGDGGPEITTDDERKVIVTDRLRLLYWVNTEFR